MANIATADRRNLAELLGSTEYVLRVPDYQRSYSWTSNEVSEFWDDISAFSDRYPGNSIDRFDYFIGSIVAVRDSATKCLTIIDGQQRLATATILLSVVRDQLSQGAPALAADLQSQLIKQTLPRRGPRYRLTLNEYDREYFRQAIQEAPSPTVTLSPKYASHKLIARARQLLVDRVAGRLETMKEPAERYDWLERMWDVIAHRITAVEVISDSEDDATEVFEILNDRGIDLSTPDLLRNFLMGQTNPLERTAVVASWGEIFGVSDNPAQVRTFLRHYWISRHGDVKATGLYREIKRVLKSEFAAHKSNPSTVSIDLSTSADVYADLLIRGTPNASLNRVMNDLRQLGAAATYPVVLAAVERASFDAAIPVAEMMRSAYVRHNVIGRLESTLLEKFLFALAHDIWETKSIDMVRSRTFAFAPNDREFEQAFATASVSLRSQQKQILTELENAMRRNEKKDDLSPNESAGIEHIYPQNPPTGERLEEHDDWINRIGNLTLLSKRINSAISNAPFSIKRDNPEGFAKSDMLLTRPLVKMSDVEFWDPEQIAHRQVDLARLAPDTWSLR